MRRTILLALVAALMPQAAAGHAVRHASMPEAYRGTWAPGAGPCTDKDSSAIVLAAKTYVGPAGSCAIEYVTEIPGRGGAIYSARLRCTSPGAPAQKKTAANLIIRSDGADQISVGPTFASLVAHRRCSADAGTGAKN